MKYVLVLLLCITFTSCDDFLEKVPLSSPSMETFWQSSEHAEMWVNNLYVYGQTSWEGLIGVQVTTYEAFSDNAFGRATARGQNNIANGTFDAFDSSVKGHWNYSIIRQCHEFFENVGRIPDLSDEKYNELAGQVNFILAFEYFKMMTRFRDIPLVKGVLSPTESDLPVSPKSEVLDYILENLNAAIELLPLEYPAAENGRITKGAALFLKSKVLLFNEKWAEAAETAKQVIDLGLYSLHPNFNELFLTTFDNSTNESILECQYVENVKDHNMSLRHSPIIFNAHASMLPTQNLMDAFEMKDGLSINESPLYDPTKPFDGRDPRFFHTFLWHGQTLNETYDPLDLTGREKTYVITYLYFKKFIVDFRNRNRLMHSNWKLFRYGELLLIYAEAKNEAIGPDDSVYDAIDLIRIRAGMPAVDRDKYGTKESLRSLIRNERRVELAGEGARYDDIIRWGIAESVLNDDVNSLNLTDWADQPLDENGNKILTPYKIEERYFDPSKHYVWPIPQSALDVSENLEQHSEWK